MWESDGKGNFSVATMLTDSPHSNMGFVGAGVGDVDGDNDLDLWLVEEGRATCCSTTVPTI